MFVGRKEELNYLENKYKSNQAEMVVLYGRRRVGKTELIRQFLENKTYIFYAASEVDDYEQRRRFSRVVKEALGLGDVAITFDTWDDLFMGIANIKSDKKIVVAIDEFPYMVNNNKSIPSILQNLWDHKLKDCPIMFVLTGSSVGVMLDELLGANNPLYGRITGSYKLLELPYEDVMPFFPKYNNEELIIMYSILGGVPQYLHRMNPELSVDENIKTNILVKGSSLYDEVQMLLKQELRESSIYFTILEAIAMGYNKLNQIHQMTQIEKSKITTYISRLIHMDIVEREYPVTEKLKKKVSVHSGLYQIKNNYFRFYFKYVFPNTSMLEMGGVQPVYKNIIEPELAMHVGYGFEKICLRHLILQNINGRLPYFLTDCGRWWYKQEEIDLVGFNKQGKYIFGEVKWCNEQMGMDVYLALQNKINNNFKQVEEPIIYLYSKSGFKKKLHEFAENNDCIHLVGIEEILIDQNTIPGGN